MVNEFIERSRLLLKRQDDTAKPLGVHATAHAPLSVQIAAAEHLRTSGRLIACLPTGTGKTLLAALPFAAGSIRPRQMIFMTPLRTLTDAQARELRTNVNQAAAAQFLGVPWEVRSQTGASAEDPRFTASAVVCTFDQALSSALSIAYSTSRRQREINAGAVMTAYLVCDEIHLFPRDQALTTLLWLLRHRPDLPFTLMTATLSQPIASALAQLLSAQMIDRLPDEDAALLGTSERYRAVRWSPEPFDGDAIARLSGASPDGRTLVVVNTVRRAQELGRELSGRLGEERVLVLHARFYPDDRTKIEQLLQDWMGKTAGVWDAPRVVVATQVVEAGLDISAGLLLTEWAPANALVQRWGRCARWGGAGRVVVAPPPGGQLPIPYARETAPAILERTRNWLEQHAISGIEMTAGAEREFLDHAHAQSDEQWVADIERRLRTQSTWIGEAIQRGTYSHAGGLIRRVDNRFVLVHGSPEDLNDPWSATGFSLARGTLHGLLRNATTLSLADDEPADEDDLVSLAAPVVPWTLKKPIWDEDDERRTRYPARWEVATSNDLQGEMLFALNPDIASYDRRYGLSLASGPSAERDVWSSELPQEQPIQFTLYRRETYADHIARMLAVYEQHHCLAARIRAVAHDIERWCDWPPGMVERVIRAAVVLHDAGKLTPRWQTAIQAYQAAAGNPYEAWLVHTDEVRGVKLEGQGPHALSGAAHSLGVGAHLDREVEYWRAVTDAGRWDDETLPSRVLATAIARHHGSELSMTALTSDELLPAAARVYLGRLLRRHALPEQIVPANSGVPYDALLVNTLAIEDAGQDAEYVALAVVSRALRLADQWSQE